MTTALDFTPYTPPPYRAPEDPYQRPSLAPTTGTLSAADTSALAYITALFREVFGGALTEFVQKAWTDYNSGKSVEAIVEELRQTPQYAARFPGMKSLLAAGRPISESTYLDLERSYTQVARQFDLPPGFYDSPDDFGKLIGSEVSPAEYQRRLTDWQTYEQATRDPTAAAEINRQFAAAGYLASEGDFLAAAIDPTRAVAAIERRLSAGQIGTEAVRAGYGQLGIDTGLRLADLGVTQDQARAGFDALAGSQQLFTALPGETGAETFGQDQQLGAAFGYDSAARRRVEAQRARRRAEFAGSSSTGIGRNGLVGLGSAAQ